MAQGKPPASLRLGRYAVGLGVVWTAVIGSLAAWSLWQNHQVTLELASNEARAHFNKDQAFRLWATAHGRIYVPITAKTQPGPYMGHVPEQVVETEGGQRLTLINPARIIRELNEEFSQLYGVSGRITSLTPLRPGNAPDPWERKALEAFETGVPEVSELTELDGRPFLRLMQPMHAQEGCLLCHRLQGVKAGNVAGGVGVYVPMEPYLARERQEMLKDGIGLATIWLLGLTGIGMGGQRLSRRDALRRSAEEELRRSELQKSAILESALDCIITMDSDGRVVEFNPAAERVFGYPREEILGRDLAEAIIPPELRERHRRGLRRYLEQRTPTMLGRRNESEALRADGSRFPVELTITHIHADTERPLFTAYLRDISERLRAEAALKESEERYALAARGANDGLWDWDLRCDVVYFSDRLKTMLGLASGAALSRPDDWFLRVHPDDLPGLRTELDAHINGLTDHFVSEHRLWHEEGIYRWMLARGLAVRDHAGIPYRIAGSISDITERKVAEEQLRHDALHDALTGLPNRSLFIDRLQRAIERMGRRRDYRFAVLFLDIDRFKVINDSLGHPAGDELLVVTARRLRETIRGADTVARLGGDEFALLLEELESVSEAEKFADRVRGILAEAVRVADNEVSISCSIGIAWGESSYRRAEEVLRDADTAMYRAKLAGKARHALFDSSMHAQAVQRLFLESDLRRALGAREFRLAYQPVVSLKDGHCSGFEALLRWVHPERGVVSPLEFIPIAEESGLIVEIGAWVLDEACRQLREWQQRHGTPLTMNVNVSARQLTTGDFAQTATATLARHRLQPSSLKLELTESILLEQDTRELLAALHEMGIRLCIDDFGTGYSAMSYLHDFPIDVLKIDRAFVSRIAEGGRETISTIIALGDNLGLEVVAEGVETAAQAELLRGLGCRYAQGFHFARPLPPDQVEPLLGARQCS